MPGIGKDVLLPLFDVWEENEAFLCDIYDSRSAPQHELKQLLDESLVGGAQDWLNRIECAAALQRKQHNRENSLCPRDTLEFVRVVWDQRGLQEVDERHGNFGWDETDRLIARARDLEAKQQALLREFEPSCSPEEPSKKKRLRQGRKKSQSGISPFWTEDTEASHTSQPGITDSMLHQESAYRRGPIWEPTARQQSTSFLTDKPTDNGQSTADGNDSRTTTATWPVTPRKSLQPATRGSPAAVVSPFFQAGHAEGKQGSPKRRLGGSVSSIPFPPLDAPRFGIVQELEAHEPFWLLIVVTFLIKTNGRFAVPVFRKLQQRFPGPEQLADPANAAEALGMIRHLGLGMQRLRFIQKYAVAFLTNPPRPGVRYRVKHYSRRESVSPLEGDEDGGDTEAWEIGHMTKGSYALDSWRIFCRDVLLGRAEDYNGKGARAEFQPEWMRVLPTDKELRAFLRWMWMREGWEWDPLTGERRVLRREMEAAVNEGRVEYDDEGNLRMLDEPREGFTREGLVVV